MKDLVFIEFTDDRGVLFRVNSKKGTYLLFKDGIPLENEKSEKKTVVFAMHYVVFLGKSFEMILNMNESIHFLPVKDGQVEIPFRIFGVSDVRLFRLPVFVEITKVPVIIFHFKEFAINTLRRYLLGEQFFIVDAEMTQSDVARLRMRFPACRVVLFREDEERVKLAQGEDSTNAIRATDLLTRDERGLNKEGAVFLARLYLRKMEWLSLWKLPVRELLTSKDVGSILVFIGTMLLKVFRDRELKLHQERLRELELLFNTLRPVFFFKKKKLKEFVSRVRLKQNIYDYLIVVLRQQAQFRKEKQLPYQERFLIKAIDEFSSVKILPQ